MENKIIRKCSAEVLALHHGKHCRYRNFRIYDFERLYLKYTPGCDCHEDILLKQKHCPGLFLPLCYQKDLFLRRNPNGQTVNLQIYSPRQIFSGIRIRKAGSLLATKVQTSGTEQRSVCRNYMFFGVLSLKRCKIIQNQLQT